MRLLFDGFKKIVGEDFLVVNGFEVVEKAYIRTETPSLGATYNQAETLKFKIRCGGEEFKKDIFVGSHEVEVQRRNSKGKLVGKKKKQKLEYEKKWDVGDFPKSPFIKLLCRLHNRGMNLIYAVDFVVDFDKKELYVEAQVFCGYKLEGKTWRQWKDSVKETKKKIEFLNSL